jgi:hypothetical protein
LKLGNLAVARYAGMLPFHPTEPPLDAAPAVGDEVGVALGGRPQRCLEDRRQQARHAGMHGGIG